MKRSLRYTAALLAMLLVGAPVTSCTPAPASGTEDDSAAVGMVSGGTADTENYKETDMTVSLPAPDEPLLVETASAEIPEALRTLTVSNDTAVNGIIERDSAFTVTTAAETDAASLARYLRVTPAAELDIEGGGTSFILRPRAVLEANTLYRFTVTDTTVPAPTLITPASFVFQTADTPRVTSVFPADRAEGVPLNTGMEITVNGVLDSTAELEKYITLEPAVSFTTEVYQHGRTLVIVPNSKLSPGTAYTVTVAAGVPLQSGRVTTEAKVFTFRTEAQASSEEKITLSCGSREITGRTDTEISFQYCINRSSYSDTAADDTVCTVYRFADAAAAAAALLDYEQNADAYRAAGKEFCFDTASLTKVSAHTLPTEAVYVSKYGRTDTFRVTLPALDAGCYVVEFTAAGKVGSTEYELDGQILVQSTDIDVSTAAAGEDLVLWLNENGTSLADTPVTVHLYDRETGWSLRRRTDGEVVVQTEAAASDRDGVVQIGTGGRACALVVIGEGEHSRYVCVGSGSLQEKTRRVYLYTDREEYTPDDTIRFWGVVTPAQGLTALTCTSNAADGVTVTVQPDGTFSGSLTYGDYAGYGVSLSFEEDGRSIASAYKTISREEKPVYTASVELDQLYYRRGDAVTATLTASFYDGTPAGGLRFAWNAADFGSGEVVTDDSGTAVVTMKAASIRPVSTEPISGYIHFELIGNDSSSLYAYASFLYFHSDLVLDMETGETGVEVTLNELDTTPLDDGSSYYTVRDRLKGAPAEGSIAVQLWRSWSERVVTGSRYDPITKKTVEITRTQWHEEIVDSFTAVFEDGKRILPYVEDPVEGSTYTYKFTFADGVWTYNYNRSAMKRTTYNVTEHQPQYALTAARADGSDAAMRTGMTRGCFVPDEEVTFTVTYGDKPLTEGRTLFVYMTPEGISAVRLSESNSDTAAFDASLSPYARVAALTYDGTVTASALTYDLLYDYQQLNRLTVTLTPDAEKCLPGETVNVTASVTDAEGSAVSGAAVLLSVVDEANFALRAQNLTTDGVLDTLVRFYSIDSAVQQRYSVLNGGTYRYYAFDEALEMAPAETYAQTASAAMAAPATGGYGAAAGEAASSVYVRENFADNPYFEPQTTDENGTAVFAVQIPDNITTWRLSAVASVRDGGADAPIDVSMGTSTDAVICSQPFFVTTTVGDLFLTGDDIALSARYSGAQDSGEAAYTAVLEDSAGNAVASAEAAGKRSEPVFFHLGKVPEGEYSVLVTARAGEHADAVRQSFTVVESAILLPVNRVLETDELSGVSPSLYPLTLTFFDGSHSLVSRAVDTILTSRNGRTDAKAAAIAAYRICGALYGASALYEDEIADLLDEVNTTGGARLYSYAEEDPLLTAKISLLLADVLSYSTRQSFIEYLENALVNTDDARTAAAALMGLASLSRPVLGDLHYVRGHFAEYNGADAAAKLHLAAAFAAAGDAQSAAALYLECAETLRVSENGEVYFRGDTLEATLELSYAALLCASLADPAEAAGLMTYLTQRSSSYEMYVLEMAVFAAAYAPDSYEEKSFTYTLNGETVTKTLSGRRPVTVTLNRDSFAKFALVDAHEDIRVRAMYIGTPDEATAAAAENVKVKKTVEPSDEGTDFYRVTVEITGTTDKDWYSAVLTDRIPTGARFVRIAAQTFNSGTDTWGWIREEAGQVRGTLAVYNPSVTTTAGRRVKSFTATYSYIIRAYTPGEFVCESTYLVERGSGSYAASERFAMKFE